MEVENQKDIRKKLEHPLVTRSRLQEELAFSPPMVTRDKEQPYQGVIFPYKHKKAAPEIFTFYTN